jgi:murein DD-endopeptidase MepM/ murein hydrolase activator NlpD
MLRVAPIAAIGIYLLFAPAGAGEMQPPRVARAAVDWDAAAASLAAIGPLQAVHASADIAEPGQESGSAPSSAIARLNAASGERLPGIAASPVPVLLPLAIEPYLRDRAAGTLAQDDQVYFAGFGRPTLFAAGPAGYDAAFRFPLAAIPDLSDIRFGTAEIFITGTLLIYALEPPVREGGASVAALEPDFPGITRSFLENHVRYSFVRFGVPYTVSIACYDGAAARFRHMACRDADRVIVRFIRLLRIAGGMPGPAPEAVAPRPPARPAAASPTFTYYGPGRLVPGTGPRGGGGRADDTVYADIRFPLADAPAFATTQYFQRRVADRGYPWRDNFCERRSFYVDQCPGGTGHQGQDIRAADCSATSTGDDRCGASHNDVVAVRDGIIMRTPGQEAVYLIVNTPTEHIRFRYLHMRPKLLDASGVVSGRAVTAGELIGQIGNFSGHENGTSYHLHFDAQVPTRAGWVFVNPYMTLVAAYERLIGGRGEELADDVVAGAAAASDAASSPPSLTLAAIRRAILVPGESEVVPAAPCARRHRGCAAPHSVRYGHPARAAAAHRSHHRS